MKNYICYVNDTLRMYKNDDIRMYNFDCNAYISVTFFIVIEASDKIDYE